MRATHGHDVIEWGLTEMLQARQMFFLAALVWQNGGGQGAKPKPIQIPGLDGQKIGKKGGYSIAEYEAIVARNMERNEVTDGG